MSDVALLVVVEDDDDVCVIAPVDIPLTLKYSKILIHM